MAREKTCKITRIDANGEQTTYTYVNKLSVVQNLASCITQEHYNIRNIIGIEEDGHFAINPIFASRLSKVFKDITQSEKFHIWHDELNNTTYCARITQ